MSNTRGLPDIVWAVRATPEGPRGTEIRNKYNSRADKHDENEGAGYRYRWTLIKSSKSDLYNWSNVGGDLYDHRSSSRSFIEPESIVPRLRYLMSHQLHEVGVSALGAISNSIAVGNNRNSSFSFGAIRPGSNYTTENGEAAAAGQAGVCARQMSQMHSLTSIERVLRVSFAADTRVSRVSFADSARFSFRSTCAYIPRSHPSLPMLLVPPPLLTMKMTVVVFICLHQEEEPAMSPRQIQDPLILTPGDMMARIAGRRARVESNAAKTSSSSQTVTRWTRLMPALAFWEKYGGFSCPRLCPQGYSTFQAVSTRSGCTAFVKPPALCCFLVAWTLDIASLTPANLPPSLQRPYKGLTNLPLQFYNVSPYSPNTTSPLMHNMLMQPMPASVISPMRCSVHKRRRRRRRRRQLEVLSCNTKSKAVLWLFLIGENNLIYPRILGKNEVGKRNAVMD
ncbi:hypothetical protein BDQ12DRAFT_670638 [Crucibulum laeve]|uniref:Uncharacterized protein n=1 Tax=Crucibulum laeve TaxID=68775 RepID=A0A5C3LW53_9AGAR|nr:hypothetical protein BDQ12DRAFT_670638 [Crucibulum laeve]